jgi:phosphatidate cytidylyltransferase
MKDLRIRAITGLALGLLFFLAFLYLPPFYFSLVLIGILLQVMLFEWGTLFSSRKLLFWLLMPFYPVLPFALLILLNQHPLYHSLLLLLFVIVSSHDTGSYLAGSLFGKRKIAPSISPGKTWEGFLGGYLIALVAVYGVLWACSSLQPLSFMAPFALFVCLLSLMGDLFESWLKRRAGVKDAGDILPGHGGFLDRFDGILFAVFFFYLARTYLITIFFC